MTCQVVELDAFRGATLVSPNFFEVIELLPPGTDLAEIEAGIESGAYTPVDLDDYTYEGVVKPDYNQAAVVTLTPTVETKSTGSNSYKYLTFKIDPSDTVLWDNREHDLLFDIKRTEIADNTNVDIWVKGTIKVKPVITE